MSTQDISSRDSRGNWKPSEQIAMVPPLRWPKEFFSFLKWLFGFPGYLWPFNVVFLVITFATWRYLTPSVETMSQLQLDWIVLVFLRNVGLIFVWFSLFHVPLYVRKSQGVRYKYTNRWVPKKNKAFLFNNQTLSNIFWCLISGGGIWSAYEVITLWAYANGLLPYLEYRSNPWAFALLMLVIPLIRHVHFYFVHRLLHWKPLYKLAHYMHHKNVNIGPWSGLSMHPVEHILYFTGALVHWVIPSHPLHVIFHLQHAGLSPAPGHTGFDVLEVRKESAGLKHGSFYHYLHHRYFECNYAGDDGMLLDKLFGSLHDGTQEGHVKMRKRAQDRMRSRKGSLALPEENI